MRQVNDILPDETLTVSQPKSVSYRHSMAANRRADLHADNGVEAILNLFERMVDPLQNITHLRYTSFSASASSPALLPASRPNTMPALRPLPPG